MNIPIEEIRLRFGQLFRALVIATLCWIVVPAKDVCAQTSVYAKQGFSMRLCFRNSGTMGRISYPGTSIARDSIGLEYPIGAPYEHILGAGLWVGGKLDTARAGTSTPIRLVSTAYEGWAGPLSEFSGGPSPADTIWKVIGRGVPRPPSWDAYWGNSIPSVSVSDNDHYCAYRDNLVPVSWHVPLHLKVIQSSYVWNDPYAEAIHIIEYKIINDGDKRIDSVYVGMLLEHYVGLYSQLPYYRRWGYIAYYPDVRTMYAHNPVDIGTTPVGVTLLGTSRDLDSLRLTFQWWVGPMTPTPDAQRYIRMSSGSIMPDEALSNPAGDSRGLFGCGPFTIRPTAGPGPDTLVVAFAIVSGQNLTVMRQRAERARIIYLSGGQVGVGESEEEIPLRFELYQNYPNPFNPSTIIKFQIPGSGHVILRVYDVLGREVVTLVNEDLAPGNYQVIWDARESASGVYFYRLEAGPSSALRKLLLLK